MFLVVAVVCLAGFGFGGWLIGDGLENFSRRTVGAFVAVAVAGMFMAFDIASLP